MTLQQADTLISGRDYVIFHGVISKVISISFGKEKPLKIEFPNEITVDVHFGECHLVNEYRGTFDSSVIPPLREDESKISIEVFVLDSDGRLTIGWHDQAWNGWQFQSDFEDDEFSNPRISEPFKWCFPPSYLKF